MQMGKEETGGRSQNFTGNHNSSASHSYSAPRRSNMYKIWEINQEDSGRHMISITELGGVVLDELAVMIDVYIQ